MLLPGGQRLGYCTNVHPYRDVAGMVAALREFAAPLRQRLCPAAPLGVGLWFPEPVAREVAADPGPLREALARHGLAVFTVNAFPQGAFHDDVVKDAVFRPGWADPARLHYTLAAADALAALLPEGGAGSLSTHTGAYAPWGGPACDPRAVAAGLLAAATGLARLADRTGRVIVLALEPEPDALLQTTAEVAAFFTERLHPAGEAARRHLGVCFDACHQAVQHEDMRASLALLREAQVPVAKVQLSSAIRLTRPARDAGRLAAFAEDRWLHQVVARDGEGRLHRWRDLPDALADPSARALEEWRVHYHVPVFAEHLDDDAGLSTTRPWLAELLALVADPAVTRDLEIETYSFDAIPPERRRALGAEGLLDALELEFRWVLSRLRSGAPSRP